MDYLTQDHQYPPQHIRIDDRLIPTAAMIANGETDELLKYNIYPHVTVEGPAPFGYTDWVFENNQYTRQPIGTTEEINAELYKNSIPTSVSALQGLLAIDQYGLSAYYEIWANDPSRTFAQKAFINRAQTWKRDDPTLLTAATDLGLTATQIDELFLLANTL